MGKDFKKKYTVSLDIDTKDAEKQIKSTVGNLKTILADLGNASDKMDYFKELVNYLSQIDSQLSNFKQKYGEDLFNKMFGDLDTNLQKEFEGIFGVAKEQLTALDQLKEKITAAKNNGATTGADLKPLEQEVRSLYESVGMLDKLDLSGKGKIETRIKKLEAAINGFAVIWDGLNDKVKYGFNFGSKNNGVVVGDIQDATKNAEKEFEKLKNLIKNKVKEVYDAQIDGLDIKALDKIKKPLYRALSLTPDDQEYYTIEDVFDELENSGDEEQAIKAITAIAEAKKKYSQELNDALVTNHDEQINNTDTNSNIEQETNDTVKVIDIAKNKLISAWKQYFNDVEEAKKDGYDLSIGGSSMQMDATQFSINQMLKDWGAKATKGKYQSNVEYALDLSGFIIDGDIGINDIENKVNELFEENGITVDIPLEKISIETPKVKSELNDEMQENTQKMESGLENVEIKTNDVSTAFQKLINYISQSGQSPQGFFNALETGAQQVEGELKNILQSLNLIDTNGNIKFTSPITGLSNTGTMLSDDYVLIARDEKKLKHSLQNKQKTTEAKALGANIGAVLEVYEDKANGLIYELQNKVSGKGILDFSKGIVNTDFLDATDEQVKKLIEDLLILQKTGLYVDWNGDNILYDKDKGFSFIDFFDDAKPPYTVEKDNTVKENIEAFFGSMFKNFTLDSSKFNEVSKFKNHINDLMDEVVNNNAQQTAEIISQDAKSSSDASAVSIKKEESAHEQNTDAINAENQALQAQIELKKKAQSMTWKNFALDESLSDLKNIAGFQSLSDMEKFWKQANYEKPIDFKELSLDEMNKIINNNSEINSLREQWYGDQDFDAKNLLENKLLENNELRNAAMNKLWQLYQQQSGQLIDFYDFINKEFEVYRGDVAPALYSDQQKHSFSFSRNIALGFINDWDLNSGEQKEDYLKSTIIKPKETLGNLATKAFENEYEMWVPNNKSPYIDNVSQSFDEYYKSLDDITKKAIDYKLIQLEKSRVENLLGTNITNQLATFTNSDIIKKFEQGEVPEQLDLTGDLNDDYVIQMYNGLPELQKKLVAYYQSLISLSNSLTDDLHNNGASTYGLSKKIGKTNIANAVISDPYGVKEHVSNLTNESKFGIFSQDAQSIQQETMAHQQNTQAIQQEQKAQQTLNDTKANGEEVVKQLLTSSLNDMWTDKFGGWKNIIDQVEKVNATKNDEFMSRVLKDGYYGDPGTGELLDYNDLLDTIQKFEQDYGENLSYVKEYLEQVFAKYISNANKQVSEIKSATSVSDDDLILDGFDSNNREPLNNLSNSEQELQIQQDITAEKQKQVTLDQQKQVDTDTETQPQGIQAETTAIDSLQSKINDVEQAVTNKTAAFTNEGTVVVQVVQQEISALDELLKKINDVKQAIDNKTAAFEKEGAVVAQVAKQEVNASKQSTSADIKAKSDTGKTTNDSFTKSLTEQTNAFNKYRENLKDVSYISDGLRTKLDDLGTSLHQITDTDGLNAWKNSFYDIQKEVTLAKNTFIAQQVGRVNQAKKALEDSFKKTGIDEAGTNLTDEQQKIIDGYMDAKAVLEAYRKSAQKGNQIELSALQNVTNELYQQIEAYKQKNNIVDATKKAPGSTVVKNATNKYKSLSNAASTEELQQSTNVQQKLNQYTTAWEKLVSIQSKFKVGETLTKDQEAEFDEARDACNKYAKELEKLLNAYNKAKDNSAVHYVFNGDFEDTDVGRQTALKQFMEDMYGADATFIKFDDNFNKMIFSVDNGDGTFTKFTATINNARTAIDVTAGEAKKATGKFTEFWNELKGKFKSIGAYLTASFSIQEVWQQIRQGIQYVREIDSALTELKKVTDETDETYDQFLQTASKTSSIIGSTVSEFTNATADFARLGYNLEQATSLAKAASVYKNVGDGIDDISQASESIISTMKAFDIEAEDAMGIVDRFNEVGNNFAISSTGIGEAMQRSASALYEAGNTIDESVALITAANSVVNFAPRRYSNMAT